MKKDDTKQPPKPSKEEIKKRSIDSLVCNENINTEDLNERADKVKDYEEAINITKEYRTYN